MKKHNPLEFGRYYSTQELARLFRANESTVKRWADSGRLQCFKTPGGHRKFTFEHVSEFLNKYHYEILPPRVPVSRENSKQGARVPVHATLEQVRGAYLGESTRHHIESLEDNIHRRYKQGITLVEIYDSVVLKMAREIMSSRIKGIISEVEKHVATTSIFETLLQFTFTTFKLPPNGNVAVCGSRTNGLQEVVLFGTAHLLESLGWKVYNLGSHTPEPVLRHAVETYKPQIVCVSIDYLIALDDKPSAPADPTGLVHFLYFDFYAQADYVSELTGIAYPQNVIRSYRSLLSHLQEVPARNIEGNEADAL